MLIALSEFCCPYPKPLSEEELFSANKLPSAAFALNSARFSLVGSSYPNSVNTFEYSLSEIASSSAVTFIGSTLGSFNAYL